MKKVILGVGILISGVIGIAAIIITTVLKTEEFANIQYNGLGIPFYLFLMLSIFGLIIGIAGACSKEK